MVSVAIMAHPKRRRFVDALCRELPEAEVVWDTDNDRWETGKRSLRAHHPDAEHHLVVQDDAIICRDLLPAAEALVERARNRPVCLYVGKVRPHQTTITPTVRMARRQNLPWIATRGPYWGVGLIVPTADIEPMIDYGDRHDEIPNYDRKIEGYYTEQGRLCWYTIPSLVDHRPVDENPSLVEGRTGNRRAHIFIGRDRSPLDIDWSPKPLLVSKRTRPTGGAMHAYKARRARG